MDRINHVKIVSPDPEAIDRFLREVVDIPAGWPLGQPPPDGAGAAAAGASAAGAAGASFPGRTRDAQGRFTPESVTAFRGAGEMSGFITGSTESRQFQLLRGDRAHVWAVAIGTRELERAHARCLERGIPCTEPGLTGWGESAIRFFFAEVGGIVFEIMRVEETS